MANFELSTSIAIVALAALCHAFFQLSLSVLTLLSSHAIGRETRRAKVLSLTGTYIFGNAIMVALIVSSVSFILSAILPKTNHTLLWAIAAAWIIAVGVAVWTIYFRRREGTALWIPRSFAKFLNKRTKHAMSSAETFSLGLVSALIEVLFTSAPILITSLVLIELPGYMQLSGLALYTLAVITPMLIIYVLIGNRIKLSHIQKWRENNKRFLQFAAGSGLMILGAFIYVSCVLALSSGSERLVL